MNIWYVSLVERQNADIVALQNEIAHLEYWNKEEKLEESALTEKIWKHKISGPLALKLRNLIAEDETDLNTILKVLAPLGKKLAVVAIDDYKV